MSLETIHWHTLHTRFLDKDSRVLDLGANIGQFAKAIVDRFGCQCIAVEPNLSLHSVIPTDPRIRKLQLAVSPVNGTVAFHVNTDSTASSIRSKNGSTLTTEQVEGRRLDDLVHSLGWDAVDLIKCDIEGAEIDVLASCSDSFLQSVGQFSIEFHDFCGITPGPVVRNTIERLRRLGFASVRMSRIGHQDTWLINRRTCPISTLEYLGARYVYRNWSGLKRIVNRWLGRAG